MAVKMATRKSGSGGLSSSLGVPKEIADALLLAKVTEFEVELTEDGLLYRPARAVVRTAPSWLNGDGRRKR